MGRAYCKKCHTCYQTGGLLIAGFCKYCAEDEILQLRFNFEEASKNLRLAVALMKGNSLKLDECQRILGLSIGFMKDYIIDKEEVAEKKEILEYWNKTKKGT